MKREWDKISKTIEFTTGASNTIKQKKFSKIKLDGMIRYFKEYIVDL